MAVETLAFWAAMKSILKAFAIFFFTVRIFAVTALASFDPCPSALRSGFFFVDGILGQGPAAGAKFGLESVRIFVDGQFDRGLTSGVVGSVQARDTVAGFAKTLVAKTLAV